jgi:hypothetical protein
MPARMRWIAAGLRMIFLHCWPVCGSGFRKFGTPLWAALILLAGLGAAGSAPADHRKHADKTDEVDTEHMFGFPEGSDIGEKGETEFETDSTGRFGRLDGYYNNAATALEAKYSLSDRVAQSKEVLQVSDLTAGQAYIERDPRMVAIVERAGVRGTVGRS